MLRLEWIDFPRYSPAPVCGMQIHSARQKLHSQAGHPQAGASNPLPPKIWAQERLGMHLSIQVLAIVSYSICMRMRVGVFGEREGGR